MTLLDGLALIAIACAFAAGFLAGVVLILGLMVRAKLKGVRPTLTEGVHRAGIRGRPSWTDPSAYRGRPHWARWADYERGSFEANKDQSK